MRNNYAEIILISVLGNIQQDKINLIQGRATVDTMIAEHTFLSFDIKKAMTELKEKENDLLEALEKITK